MFMHFEKYHQLGRDIYRFWEPTSIRLSESPDEQSASTLETNVVSTKCSKKKTTFQLPDVCEADVTNAQQKLQSLTTHF